MEDFKNCLPERVSTYLNEQKVSDVFKAAVLVDEYLLTHKTVFVDCPFSSKPVESMNGTGRDSTRGMAVGSEGVRSPGPSEPEVKVEKEELRERDNVRCFYCEKQGHIVASCPVLKKQNSKPVALVNKFDETLNEFPADLADFAPFVMEGFVSLAGSSHGVPVKMLRDTAASQSFILEGVLPFSDKAAVGSEVPVLGFGMKDIGVLLHKVCVKSDLVSGEVNVEVHPRFPIQGVSFLLGNDLAGGKVLVTPEVTPVPVRQSPDELAERFPKVFAACAVTLSRYKQDKAEVDLSDSFICDPGVNSQVSPETVESKSVDAGPFSEVKHLSLTRDQLMAEQKNDATFSPLLKLW